MLVVNAGYCMLLQSRHIYIEACLSVPAGWFCLYPANHEHARECHTVPASPASSFCAWTPHSPSGMRLRTEAASSSSWAMEWRKARRHLAGGHSHRLAACRRQVCLLQGPHVRLRCS